jgi:hypothetical protein
MVRELYRFLAIAFTSYILDTTAAVNVKCGLIFQVNCYLSQRLWTYGEPGVVEDSFENNLLYAYLGGYQHSCVVAGV